MKKLREVILQFIRRVSSSQHLKHLGFVLAGLAVSLHLVPPLSTGTSSTKIHHVALACGTLLIFFLIIGHVVQALTSPLLFIWGLPSLAFRALIGGLLALYFHQKGRRYLNAIA